MATTSATQSNTNTLPADFLASVNKGYTAKTTESSMQVTEDRFLKLLTTQLKNQDPLNPMDNAQMTSQMAQISTVNGIEKLNTSLEKLMNNSSDTQAMQAATLLGHQVLVNGSGMSLAAGSAAFGGVELTQSVDKATVTITDGNGLAVRTLELGTLPSGLKNFAWDGKNDAGQPVVAGRYKFSVSAEQAGKSVSATTLELAPVNGVMRDKSGILLELGQMGSVSIDDVRQIF